MLLLLLSLFFGMFCFGTLYNRSPRPPALWYAFSNHGDKMVSVPWNQQRVGIPENAWAWKVGSKRASFLGQVWPMIFQGEPFVLLVSGCVLVTDVDSHLKTRFRRIEGLHNSSLHRPGVFLLSYAPRSWLEIQYSLESFIELPRSPSLFVWPFTSIPFLLLPDGKKEADAFAFFLLPKVFKAKCVFLLGETKKAIFFRHSMYGATKMTDIWVVCGVNGGKYAIQSVSGIGVEAPLGLFHSFVGIPENKTGLKKTTIAHHVATLADMNMLVFAALRWQIGGG